ncbi:MAG: VWA domain-containing protein [Gammaproteobacteria bacterium]|jgi:Ca-activated chloride channel family protein
MPEAFHFQQPMWFLALLPLVLLVWQLRGDGSTDSAWRRVCDANLLPYLLINPQRGDSRLPLWLLAGGWLVAVIALADPVWEKQPQPVFRTEEARVVVLDLSRSMSSSDLKPSRLERARYKIEDVLRRSEEGQVGLVVFAGDAFVVTPLTQDTRTITELLKSLEPGIMPVQGSRVDLGLRKAGELLTQAGAGRGEILLVTDGYEGSQAIDAARDLRRQGYTVSVLGVGTTQGAPLSDGGGGFVHDGKGAIVVPRLDAASLRALATAGGGRYATITGNGADLKALLTPLTPQLDSKVKQTGLQTDAWRSRGPWLVVLLLPFAALAFRRGWLLGVILLVAATATPPQPAMASTWDDLWTRRDQQAAQALAAGEHARAAQLATDPRQRGTAQYRAGKYAAALEDFKQATGPDAAYNQGNALARLGHYKEAIAAYDQALAAQPNMEDAQHNKAAVEALLREQEKQKQQQQQQQQQGQQGQQEQQSGQNGSGSEKQEGSEGDSSTQSDQQAAKQSSGGGKEGSAAQAASDKEKQDDKSSGSSADTEPDRKDQEQAGDQAASRDKAQHAGEKGVEPQDNKTASGTGKASTPDTGDNPESPPATNEAKAQASAQESPQAARQQAAARPAGEQPAEDGGASGAQAAADTTSTEEQQATEQWLRRIPDDPGGLLRRKFLYQYRQRAASADSGSSQDW